MNKAFHFMVLNLLSVVLVFFAVINTISFYEEISLVLSKKIVSGKILDKKIYNKSGLQSDKYMIKVSLPLENYSNLFVGLTKKSWYLLNIGDTLKIKYSIIRGNNISADIIGHSSNLLSVVFNFMMEMVFIVLGLVLTRKAYALMKMDYKKRKNNNYLSSKGMFVLTLFLTCFYISASLPNMISEVNAYPLTNSVDNTVFYHICFIIFCFAITIFSGNRFLNSCRRLNLKKNLVSLGKKTNAIIVSSPLESGEKRLSYKLNIQGKEIKGKTSIIVWNKMLDNLKKGDCIPVLYNPMDLGQVMWLYE
jgi:hypothetical protein